MTHIGILGGGQLAQMTLQAMQGYSPVPETSILEKETANICRSLATQNIDGSLQDPAAIRQLVESVDITTYEIEHIDIQTLLQLEAEGHRFSPSPKVLHIIQDKGLQKQFFTDHNLPTASYHLVDGAKGIHSVADQYAEEKLVLKSRTGGYDGKGVMIVAKEDLDSTDLFFGPTLVEQYISGATEIAVMIGRTEDGQSSSWDPVEMVFNEYNTLDYQLCPARISQSLAEQAQTIATQAIEALAGVGVFAVEFFLTVDNELLINEIAPRPHNSGHHTIDAAATSQFAQLTNILLGRALGSVNMKQPSMMINLLGPADHVGAYQLVDEAAIADDPHIFVHLYGKSPSKPNRKLGHITILGNSREELIDTYETKKHLLCLQAA